MRLKVHKYELPRKESSTLAMPIGAKILKAERQHGISYLWVLENPDEERRETRVFRIVETGRTIKNVKKIKYLNSIMEGSRDEYVFHVFEVLG